MKLVVDSAGRPAGAPERRFESAEFPLVLGGPESDFEALGGSEAVAYLGLSDGELFVQPNGSGGAVEINGAPLTASHWLHDADVLRVELADEASDRVSRWRLRLSEQGGDWRLQLQPEKAAEPAPEPVPVPAAGRTIRPIEFQPRATFSSRGGRGWRPALIALALFLLALSSVAAFVFTARSVSVEIEPEPERLSFEGSLFAPELGGRHLLWPGRYTLKAEREGYRPLEEAVEIGRSARQELRFAMQKLPGRLEIRAPEGAAVEVDGEAVGTAPLAAIELAAGEHVIGVEAERYRPLRRTVEIAGGGETQILELDLEPRWAEVGFSSEPSGARLRVDGREVGTTPITAEVLEGGRTYELLLAGHKPHRGRLQVVAQEAQQVPTVRLQPSDGNLMLSSDPEAAAVTVDGKFRGQTPLDLFLAPGRGHRLKLSKAGHTAAEVEIELASGESRELNVELEPELGEVRIVARPPQARVYVDGVLVDGEPRGPAGQTLRLSAVPHEIEVRLEGHEPYRSTVHPLAGFPQRLEVELVAEGRAGEPKLDDALEGPNGHRLQLIEPAAFQMGASRREPGRRSNETLHQVELTRPFYIATQEVSNQQFRRFKSDHLSGQLGGHNLEIDHHPAVRVSWEDAVRYCNWLSERAGLPAAYELRDGTWRGVEPMTTGYRLPSEAEWAYVARQAGPEKGLKYPWGSSLPIAPGSGNYGDTSARLFLKGALPDYSDGFAVTAPVESFAPNAFGLYNLGGNVAEWVHDLYDIRSAFDAEVPRDPLGPDEGEFHVIRGSSFLHSTITELRLSFRDYGKEPRPDVGFRIARYAE